MVSSIKTAEVPRRTSTVEVGPLDLGVVGLAADPASAVALVVALVAIAVVHVAVLAVVLASTAIPEAMTVLDAPLHCQKTCLWTLAGQSGPRRCQMRPTTPRVGSLSPSAGQCRS
jgi:hypothetical protein